MRFVRRISIGLALAGLLALSACNSAPPATLRGDLLDDKVTALRIRSALGAQGAAFKAIDISVKNGVAILRGTVSSPQARAKAEQIARGVDRVKDVQDQLQVRGPQPPK